MSVIFECILYFILTTTGLRVFRGKMSYLGKLKEVEVLPDFLEEIFKLNKRLPKEILIDRLEKECGIPPSDACHFIEKLQQEGLMSESSNGEVALVG